MALFFDTSALAKLYHEEAGSGAVERLFDIPGQVVLVSRLGILEMHSVLSGKMRTREITVEAVDVVLRRFRSDAREKRFRVVGVLTQHYEGAEDLLHRHGVNGLRTLDALQLAVALDLHRNGFVESMVAADRVLGRVAPLEGLTVLNPEEQ